MRKNRVWYWIICIFVAFLVFKGEAWFTRVPKEVLPIYVYAPEDMKKAFERTVDIAGLEDDYKIVMIDDKSKANIIVEMDKEYDSKYSKIAYSPFVVVYSSEDANIKSMIKEGLLQDSFVDAECKEINFNKVIQEVVEEGKWENLGVKDMGTIKVYYPKPSTKYYTDYYDFMLVTVNNGKYPKDETELKKAMEQIERFEKSEFTEEVEDFSEKFNRTGGFLENTLYLIPEHEADMLAGNNSEYGRLFYPTTTVYANYYLKTDELGSKLVDVFDYPNTFKGNFYDYLENASYRSDWDNKLNDITSYLYDSRDVYDVQHLDKNRIRPRSIEINNETPEDTKEASGT